MVTCLYSPPDRVMTETTPFDNPQKRMGPDEIIDVANTCSFAADQISEIRYSNFHSDSSDSTSNRMDPSAHAAQNPARLSAVVSMQAEDTVQSGVVPVLIKDME